MWASPLSLQQNFTDQALDFGPRPSYTGKVLKTTDMTSDHDQDEYLTRCIVNTTARNFTLLSNLGEERTVHCDNVDEFMNVLSVVRATLDDRSELVYANPLVAN